MKNRTTGSLIAAIGLTLALTFDAAAQDTERVWSFGPEVGVNFSKYGNDADTDFRTGILLGLGLTYSIQNTYGVTGKILYSQKGAKFGEDEKQSLQYIEVPIVGRFFFNREGVFRPNLFVGPSFAFLTGAASKDGDGDSEDIDNYKDVFNTFDFGVTGGLGFNWLI
ncbi:MAG TPA: porin family protein, partial [Ohtaekwangia sp.]|nr:porin family protein [Ohtaekwangia sp.]